MLISVCLMLTVCAQSGVWHHGHRVKQWVVYKLALAATMLPFMTALVLGSVAPPDQIPFGSYLHFVAVFAATLFTSISMGKIMPVAIPHEPQRSLLPIAGKALIFTIRVVDTCTDISFVRVLVALVRLLSL